MPLLIAAIRIYWVIILVRCIFSWLPAEHRSGSFYLFLLKLTEPVLAPVRKLLPAAGGLDFSPMVVLILLSIVARSLPPV
jgi:YggT family protein